MTAAVVGGRGMEDDLHCIAYNQPKAAFTHAQVTQTDLTVLQSINASHETHHISQIKLNLINDAQRINDV